MTIRPEYLRLAAGAHRADRGDPDGARPGLAAGRDLHGGGRCEAARRLACPRLLLLGGQGAARRPRRSWCPMCRSARSRSSYSFTGAELLLFGAILYPGGTRAGGAGGHHRRAQGAEPVDHVARKAEGRGHLDQCRQHRISGPHRASMRSPRPGRSTKLVDEQTAAIYELGLTKLQLSPASLSGDGGDRPFRRRSHRSECGGAGLYLEQPGAVEITDGVLYRARICRSPRGS